MTAKISPLLLLGASLLTLPACASSGGAGGAAPAAREQAAQEDNVLIGPVTREQIEEKVPEWVQAEVEAAPDAEAAQALTGVEPGAEVTVFLGTWCGDSRREVPRLWRALDEVGGEVPFAVQYIGVDRQKKEPAAAVAESDIHFVPTLIVTRNGREVGRIVETSPNGVEKDLLALLTGKAQGRISASQPEAAPPAQR
ncbi:MAG TPA: thioredoxin family protein [Thermoanaerobaculia bacterium]